MVLNTIVGTYIEYNLSDKRSNQCCAAEIVYKRLNVILSEANNLADSSSPQFVGTPQNDII